MMIMIKKFLDYTQLYYLKFRKSCCPHRLQPNQMMCHVMSVSDVSWDFYFRCLPIEEPVDLMNVAFEQHIKVNPNMKKG